MALCDRLQEVGYGAIKHVDLWNRNVEFIEQESGWPRPAVFIEFGDISWKVLSGHEDYVAKGYVHLHVVTDWVGGTSSADDFRDENLRAFDLLDSIHASLKDLSLAGVFSHIDLESSRTDHNHEGLLENIETYRYTGHKKVEG